MTGPEIRVVMDVDTVCNETRGPLRCLFAALDRIEAACQDYMYSRCSHPFLPYEGGVCRTCSQLAVHRSALDRMLDRLVDRVVIENLVGAFGRLGVTMDEASKAFVALGQAFARDAGINRLYEDAMRRRSGGGDGMMKATDRETCPQCGIEVFTVNICAVCGLCLGLCHPGGEPCNIMEP